MRTFYIFKIKYDFYSLYLTNPNNLYILLNQLYYIKRKDLYNGYSIFNQLIDNINKEKIERHIYEKYHKEMIYTKNDNDHIINNLYKDEVSILTIKKFYILINVNKNYTSFFSIINDLGNNYFVCDFLNKDYFWINDIKMLV